VLHAGVVELAVTLVSAISAYGRESSNLSSSTRIFVATEGAGERSPSRLENGGLVTSQRGSIPPPSAKTHGRQARPGEQRTPNPLLQSSNLWSPATPGRSQSAKPFSKES
jgi:hypothetical protein